MNSTPDGDYQTYRAENGAFIREHFFGRDPRTRKMVEDLSDDQIWSLKRGGHDYRKVFAAYSAATQHTGQPTVILAKTIKGYGLGANFAGRNATHQMKKLSLDDLKTFRDGLRIPISDAQLESDPYLPAVLPPGAGQRGDPVPARAAARPRRVGAAAPHPLVGHRAAGRRGLQAGEEGLRQAADRHHDGVRPDPQGPDAGQGVRPPDRADHPRRGAHVRDGLVLPDDQDLQPARAELHLGRPRADARVQGVGPGPDPARRHQRGRLDRRVHRRRHVVRDARRADDPDLRLLLDVRVPAHRRLDLGGRRPDEPRLPDRRHRRPHHAHRRGPAARRRPLAAAGVHEPGRRVLRPGVRVRDRAHHARRPGADVRPRHRRRPLRATSCTT